jgi:hypothetical protein
MAPKPYIELADFPRLTPFTVSAIRMHIQRGVLIEGRHFFRHGRRLVFKWAAIEEWIERRTAEFSAEPMDIVPLRRHA